MLQQFTCNGKSISRLQSNGFFNLTELVDASGTGKRLDNWFRLKETYQYVTLLAQQYSSSAQDLSSIFQDESDTTDKLPHILHGSQDKDSSLPQLDLRGVPSKYRLIQNLDSVLFTKEGRHGGTWGHPTLAINLMRWLSPAFALWCDEHILRLLDTGKTFDTLRSKLTSLLPDNMILNPSQYEEVSTQLRQFKYAVDYTDSLYRERDIVLRYREQGLPDYEMYLFGEIISPCYFDREYETLIRKLSLWITKIQEFEGQPELQKPYLNSVHEHFNFVRQRISLLFSLPDRVLNNNTLQQLT